MFDIGWGELVVIGVVALIAIGPKELPGVLRTCGQWMGKIRRMASEFQGQFQEAMREAEMADIKKQVDDIAASASNLTSFDPIDHVRKEIESVTADKPQESTAEPVADPIADLPPLTEPPPEVATAEPAPPPSEPATPPTPPKSGEGA